jgi:segregation and condensation protein B
MEQDDRLKVLELLLWLTDRPLKIADLQRILGDDAPTDATLAGTALAEPSLREDLTALARSLDAREAPYHLLEVAQGFQLASRPAYSQWVRRLFREKTVLRLSPSALETLSIIAYKQPLTRGEMEEVRGVDVGGVVETLLERKLIKVVGRKEALGRPLLYGTTTDFMKQFGLKSLEELPKLDELVPPDDPTGAAPPVATGEETSSSEPDSSAPADEPSTVSADADLKEEPRA